MKTFFFFGEHLHLDRKTVQILGKTFFFFLFLENTFIWIEKPFKFWERPFFFFGEHLHLDRKTVQISGKHLNLGRKNRLNFDRETQCIKSFFGQKFAAPPNHFELLRPWMDKTLDHRQNNCYINSLIAKLSFSLKS